jgi:predicted amidohydrolase
MILFAVFSLFVYGCSTGNGKEMKTMSWEFYTHRGAISPRHRVDDKVRYGGKPTLTLSGDGKGYVNGSWTKTFDVDPGKYYECIVHFKPEKVYQINRTIMAQIEWQGADRKRRGVLEFPGFRATPTESGWYELRETYLVPDGCVKARVNLIYRWNPDGKVFFEPAVLNEVPAPKPRMVRLATIYHRPKNTASPEDNLKEFVKFINMAGEKKADIVCLPEGITVIGTGKKYLDVAESVPGPTTDFLGKLAKKHHMYLIAGLYEREGPAVYNTAVLMGRDGTLKGKYRKASLPTEEIVNGLTPGDSFPVFETDFGKIGIMICYDVYFPEPARMLAFHGAEVIFLPIWGGILTLAKARAISNQIYLVSSSYDMKTGIFNRAGELIAEADEGNPVVVTEVDLNRRQMWGNDGEFRNKAFREMPDSKAIRY